MTITATPTLADVLLGAIDNNRANLRVALPGRVETYDATTQSCSVQLLVYDGVNDETGTRKPEKLPVITSVPVCFPGSGGSSITWPLKAGDTVLVVFASSSIDRWLALGGEVDPIDDRRHHISDAIAIPGLRDFAHALPSTATDPAAMVINSGAIKLGGSAASAAVALNTELAGFWSVLTGWTPVANDGGAALKTAVTAYVAAHSGFPVGSTTTKVK